MKMASIDLMHSAVETKYMEEIYNSIQYEKLDQAIRDICTELEAEVFTTKETISEIDWQTIGQRGDFKWLWSF